jgi:glycosyltransferase involved in cell wall biosynthesis
MRIAINARFAGLEQREGYGRFTRGLLSTWNQIRPDDELSFLYDRLPEHPVPVPAAQHLHKGPMARHPLLWKIWYDVSLPAMARKAKADVLFSPDGFCSLTTRIPQVLAIHDLAFLHYPQGISRLYQYYYRHYTPEFIRKAAHILTVSEHSKQDILRHYPKAAHKISVIYNAADPGFQQLEWEEKEKVKEEWTQGHDYFLYAGAIHPRKNMVNLLKGFSWFKHRHKSGMKLVLAGRIAWGMDDFQELLGRYKYRQDVLLTGYVADASLQQLMGAAYALVYPSYYEGFGRPVLEAMQCGTPVICSQTGALPEVAGEAAHYVAPEDAESIGKALGLLYKDETYRNQRIRSGHEQAKRFSWEAGAQKLSEILLSVS